jgi:hypothetical protein
MAAVDSVHLKEEEPPTKNKILTFLIFLISCYYDMKLNRWNAIVPGLCRDKLLPLLDEIIKNNAESDLDSALFKLMLAVQRLYKIEDSMLNKVLHQIPIQEAFDAMLLAYTEITVVDKFLEVIYAFTCLAKYLLDQQLSVLDATIPADCHELIGTWRPEMQEYEEQKATKLKITLAESACYLPLPSLLVHSTGEYQCPGDKKEALFGLIKEILYMYYCIDEPKDEPKDEPEDEPEWTDEPKNKPKFDTPYSQAEACYISRQTTHNVLYALYEKLWL